jgi:hypothetical protein
MRNAMQREPIKRNLWDYSLGQIEELKKLRTIMSPPESAPKILLGQFDKRLQAEYERDTISVWPPSRIRLPESL